MKPAAGGAPKRRIAAVYRRLMAAFGPQGWWPVAGKRAESVYRPRHYGPHSGLEMFEICAGAILTQNTSWNNARAALAALKAAGKLEPARLARLQPRRLAALIRSSGFYRQKAVRLRAFAGYILREHPAGLKRWFADAPAADLRRELLGLKGIGPETADSMLLYAGRKRKFVVDAYTARIFGRLGSLSGSYGELQDAFEKTLPRDHRVYNEYHALIAALAKNYCRKSLPRCGQCPLNAMCPRRMEGNQEKGS